MRACLLAAFLVMATTACFGQAPHLTAEVKWGIVEGVVIDGEGKPLPGSTVTSYTQARTTTRDVMQYQAAAGEGGHCPAPSIVEFRRPARR